MTEPTWQPTDDDRQAFRLAFIQAADTAETYADVALRVARPIIERELRAAARVEAERVAELNPARIDRLEKMARDANAECIKHWNRADKAETERDALRAVVEQVRAYVDEPGNWSALDGRRGRILALLPEPATTREGDR